MVERKNVHAPTRAEPVVSLTSASPWFDRAGLLPAFDQSLIPILACFGCAVSSGQRSTKRAHGVRAYIPDRPLIILFLMAVPHACRPGVNDEHPELI
jgi:hypothetical protein